jgi:hypothetical protein
MSNRSKWAHWNKSKSMPSEKRGLGLSLIAIGGTLVLVGIVGLANHIMWFQNFSPRFGSFVNVPTASFLIGGGVFIAFGVVAIAARK